MSTDIVVLKLFPGINKSTVEAIIGAKGIRAVVLETYGSGNAPRYEWFIEPLKDAVKRGLTIVNVTQCEIGCVEMQRYDTGRELLKAGVISGYDGTIEATITKLMFLLGNNYSREELVVRMRVPLAGEITRPDARETF